MREFADAMSKDNPEDAAERVDAIQAAINSDLPNYYITGFKNGLGAQGVIMLGEQNGRPQVIINMSHSMAKSLAVKLSELIERMEAAIGAEVLTHEQLESKLKSIHVKPATTKDKQ